MIECAELDVADGDRHPFAEAKVREARASGERGKHGRKIGDENWQRRDRDRLVRSAVHIPVIREHPSSSCGAPLLDRVGRVRC